MGNPREEKDLQKQTPNRKLLTYILIITLNTNVLNTPIKRHRLALWMQKKTHIYVVFKTPI